MYRIGQSTDIHQLVENRKLILGGVEIPSTLHSNSHYKNYIAIRTFFKVPSLCTNASKALSASSTE